MNELQHNWTTPGHRRLLQQRIEAMPISERAGALIVLDELTRPLTATEIRVILRKGGMSSTQAMKCARLLLPWRIVAMLPNDGAGE